MVECKIGSRRYEFHSLADATVASDLFNEIGPTQTQDQFENELDKKGVDYWYAIDFI